MKAPGPVLRLKFDVPGCYPSGSVMGTKGETITFTRAGTKVCGVPTCQANELCVTADGAHITTGESLTVAWPASVMNERCVAGTFKPDAAWTAPGAQRNLWNAGPIWAANTAMLYSTGESFFVNLSIDSAAALRGVKGPDTTTLASGSAHRVVACASAGTPATYFDGALTSGAPEDPGTGVWAAPPATLWIGGSSAGDATVFVGAVKDFKVCGSSDPARCR